jgi:lysophospholipase L1-like esterase
MRANRIRTLTGALGAAASLLLPAAAAAQVDTGSANFTRYVALGDSLTAGFEAASLHVNAQNNSYPALIHRQATGGASGFQQPFISEPGIPGKLVLRTITASGIPVITPEPATGQPINLGAPAYQNLAVPGADVHDVLATNATAGGLHQIILRDKGTQLQAALVQSPTFVTLWIGNNDVLGAATSGIVVEGVTLTPVAQFEADYRAITAAIAASGARMAIANIPDVTTIPFVTTVSRFVTLPNGVVFNLVGPEGPIGPNDFVLLSAAAAIQQGRGIPAQIGGAGPLGNEHVLSAAEVATIRARIAAYNAIIRAEATARGAAFVDINAALVDFAARGRNVGGILLTPAFLTGGIFSYDGVHPTSIGYGLVANEFIESINAQFDAEIPPANLAALMFAPGTLASSAGGGKAMSFEGLLPFYFSPQAWNNLRWALRIPQTLAVDQNPPRRPRRRGRG